MFKTLAQCYIAFFAGAALVGLVESIQEEIAESRARTARLNDLGNQASMILARYN